MSIGKNLLILIAAVTLALLYLYSKRYFMVLRVEDNHSSLQNKIISQNYSPSDQSSKENVITPESEGVYVSIKTTTKYHKTRLPSIILTWLQNLSPSQIHLVTDGTCAGKNDTILGMALDKGFNVTYANCPLGHGRISLCCKSGVEFRNYYTNERNWYCHFDDDVYVNVPKLVSVLSEYNPIQDKIYIGKWSRKTNVVRLRKKVLRKEFPGHKKEVFQYATGAAFCISKSLMAEMKEYLWDGFLSICKRVGYPDDMMLGYLIEAVLGYNLTNEPSFNSNLDPMIIPPESLNQQVTISYRIFPNNKRETRRVNIPGARYTVKEDPTRFMSYHCFLYPNLKACS